MAQNAMADAAATELRGPQMIDEDDQTTAGAQGDTVSVSVSVSAEHNLRLARHWIETFNARDHAAEDQILCSDYAAHAPASLFAEPLDRKAWGEFLAMFIQGFPDLHLEITDAVGDEHRVAQRILFTGTHTGDFNGLPPTGRRVSFTGLELNRLVDGCVAEHWFELDQVALLKQLGLTVVPGPTLIPRLIAGGIRKLVGSRRS